ncbi:MAG: LysM peptidoglycan-binding domain-containing M23 family metallopeptidase [Deltaproteobacteria bacterium]|nr:LysM peptidoglycan-binding domain-containing M23 family metallopeptidase [Deltaproteobacteria bacterium]
MAAILAAAPGSALAHRPAPRVYEIRSGDTVSEIAERFEVDAEAIVRANQLEGDGSRILAGEEIVIPADGVEIESPQRFRLPADPSAMVPGSGEMAVWLIARPPTKKLLRSAGRGPRVPETLRWPVSSRRIGRGFGSGREGRHFSLDIPAPMGERVRAAAGGYVAYAGPFRGYGNTVILVHPGGAVTLYAHLTHATAPPRRRVRRGDVIGRSGSTGLSRGPHLHFGMFVDGRPFDPAPLLRPAPTYNGGRYGYEPPVAAAETTK